MAWSLGTKALTRMVARWGWPRDILSNNGTNFVGGVFERMIRSAKRPIQAILGNADVKDEELMTVFTGVESLSNSSCL